jgi:hypothetical protein
MLTNTATLAHRATAARAPSLASTIVRFGAAFCFIGHGAFGFITKAAWLPYFAVAGIPERWAWSMMPWIGAVDVIAGMAVLFAPRRLPLLYMVVWGATTALLRPLAGEPVFETLERAGNYGVPLAFLVWVGWPRPRGWHSLVAPLAQPLNDERTLALVGTVLKWTTVVLLAGHGALGALTGKAMLTAHYAAIGLPASTTALVGWFELAIAAAMAWRPGTALLLFVAAWKLATESLFVVAGDPIWEFVERAGSYAAPLALAVLLAARTAKTPPPARRRSR